MERISVVAFNSFNFMFLTKLVFPTRSQQNIDRNENDNVPLPLTPCNWPLLICENEQCLWTNLYEEVFDVHQ